MKLDLVHVRPLRLRYLPLILATLLFMVAVTSTFAQQLPFNINGRLMDEKGKVISATIRSTKNGTTISDQSGKFHLTIKSLPDTLLISVIGYKTIRKNITADQKNIDLLMSAVVQELNEVLVQTGYQTLKPNEINGTVSVIDERALNSRSGTNILDRIIGQSTGLLLNVGKHNGNPQNKTNISVRGPGTINGPLDPLIVLDGFIYEGDIGNINPNDVESVSVLKDASAASIWGARAGNGVIVITTKKGKLNQALQIGFNANVMVQQLPDLFAISQISAADNIAIERLMFNKGYFDDQIVQTPFQALTPAVEILLAMRSGQISNPEAENKLSQLSVQDTRQSYLDNFYTNAITRQYALNVSGGSAKNAYFLSAALDQQKGETYSTKNKLNIHLVNDFKPTDRLTISTGVYFTASKDLSGRPAFNTLTVGKRTASYFAFRDIDGTGLPFNSTYRSKYTDTAGNGKLLDWKFYPLEDYKHATSTLSQQEIFGTVGLKYKILDGLNVDLSYQYQKQHTEMLNISDVESYAARNLINTYTQINNKTGQVIYIIPKGGINAQEINDLGTSTGRTQLNFNKQFGLHDVNGIFGIEARQSSTSGRSNILYGYQADPLSYTNVDVVNAYPEFLTGNLSDLDHSGDLSQQEYRFISFYANAAYSYKNRYRISGSVRRDGSNIFGANTNDKWKPLWSAGLGWSLNDEDFFKVDWLTILRLSTSYGSSGNVDLTRTASPVAGYGSNSTAPFPFTRITSINNPDLKWEQLSQLNFKLDFALKSDRLKGALAYFMKHGTDLYGPALYDYTGWGSTNQVVRNVADMKGYGVELELHSLNINHKDFNWRSDFYFNYNNNKTEKYYSDNTAGIFKILGTGSTINPVVGQPLYAISAYKWGGLSSTGDPQGYLNGQLSTDYQAIANEASVSGSNLEYIGAASPMYFGSVINTLSWKAFSLSFNLNFKLGYYLMKPVINYSKLVGNGVGHADYTKRWQKPGDESITNVPAFVYLENSPRDIFYGSSSINAVRGDHIRLDYINIAYRLGGSDLKMPFKNLECYGSLLNAGLIWKANNAGVDPDYARNVPPVKTFVLGVRSSF